MWLSLERGSPTSIHSWGARCNGGEMGLNQQEEVLDEFHSHHIITSFGFSPDSG